MTRLTDQIEAARAHLADLERQGLNATCFDMGHVWVSMGGRNCGCHKDACCSVPVHKCSRCGLCDYGHNALAAQHIEHCGDKHPPEYCPSCYRTDGEYSERVGKGLEAGKFACADPWHGDDHLRSKAPKVPPQKLCTPGEQS